MQAERIQPAQVMVYLVVSRLSIALIWFPGLYNPELQQDVWLAVFLGSLLVVPLAWVMNRLWLRFPDKTFTEVIEIVFGKVLGRVVVLLYIWFWLSAFSALLRFAQEFTLLGLLPRTPMVLIGATVAIVAAWGAKAGLEVFARAGQVIFPLLLGTLFLLMAMLFKDMQFRTLQPVFEHVAPIPMLRAVSDFVARAPDIVMTGMMVPFVNQRSKLLRAVALAELGVGAVFALMVVTVTTVLGPLRQEMYFHFFATVSVISVADFLERADGLLVSVWIFANFVYTASQLWAAAVSTAQVLGLHNYRPLVLPLAGIGLTYSILQAENFGDWIRASEMGAITPFLILIYWLIPFLVLGVAAIRGQRTEPRCAAG